MKVKKRSSRRTKSLFLEKLFVILSNEAYSKYIHWSPDGSCLVISDPIGFTTKVLPEWYNYQNFSGFVRQLNIHNFIKVKNTEKGGKREIRFKYDNLLRDDIKSKKSVKNETPEKPSLQDGNIPNEDP